MKHEVTLNSPELPGFISLMSCQSSKRHLIDRCHQDNTDNTSRHIHMLCPFCLTCTVTHSNTYRPPHTHINIRYCTYTEPPHKQGLHTHNPPLCADVDTLKHILIMLPTPAGVQVPALPPSRCRSIPPSLQIPH